MRIFFDGLNLALPKGTGIATYTRVLVDLARTMGHQTGILYSARQTPSKNLLMREIAFFDERRSSKTAWLDDTTQYLLDQVRCQFTARPVPLTISGTVIARQFEGRLPQVDGQFLARSVFELARYRFRTTGDFLPVAFDTPPDIMHCTYQLPLRAKGARNIYTLHDLVPLRLPFTTLDNKRRTFRLFKKIADEADHIVTVSEQSRRDIIDLLGVDESRVTNTYQAVHFPSEYLERSSSVVSEQLSGSLGLGYQEYLLFFGAFEPKKNVGRIIDAYLASGVDIPLIIVASEGWSNEAELRVLAEQKEKQKERMAGGQPLKRKIVRFEYVSRSMLVTLIRGARAVLFPSLYEGFGLPVLEAMTLGTPVVTANTSSLPEIAGDAALFVDPYDVDDISRAIRTITQDADLRAELVRRGQLQAEKFSLAKYQERMQALYAKLA